MPAFLILLLNGVVAGLLSGDVVAVLLWCAVWCPISGFAVGFGGLEWADRYQERLEGAKWLARLDALERLHDRDMARWN